MKLSKAIQNCIDDPMLRFRSLARKAEQRGIEVIGLDDSQPDSSTSDVFFAAAGAYVPEKLDYAPANGLSIMAEALQNFYRRRGMNYDLEDILVTAGASEALMFAMQCILDPDSEVIVPEPFYHSLRTDITVCGGQVRPLFTTPEEGYSYATREQIEPLITPETRAILLCNPCNPTGRVLSRAEMQVVANIVKERSLWLIADETYREFIYDGEPDSFGQMPAIEQQVVLVDSASNSFSVGGARVGALITKNREFMRAAGKLAKARRSVATLNQVAAAELYLMDDSAFASRRSDYARRRDLCLEAMRTIPGVVCAEPKGALFLMARLPVDDTGRFQQWLLEDFDLDGQTILLAPGSCFYSTYGCGRSEVRVSYVVDEQKLLRAMEILTEALRRYPGTLEA